MFEEFNKKKIIEDFPAPVSAKMYPKEVLEIHNEFNTALALLITVSGLAKWLNPKLNRIIKL